MRNGILEQVPETFPENKLVFVVGHDNEPGVNHLKTFIATANRKEEWIRAEWRKEVQDVPEKAGIILIMAGVTNGTLANVRKKSVAAGIPCVNNALSVGEVKTILGKLQQGRSRLVNGNGKHHEEESGGEEREVAETFSVVSENREAESIETSPAPSRVDMAFEKLEKFKLAAEETQLAVMEIADELAEAASKIESSKEELEKERERVTSLTNENSTLRGDNERLREENLRLQGTLDSLSSLIKMAKGG